MPVSSVRSRASAPGMTMDRPGEIAGPVRLPGSVTGRVLQPPHPGRRAAPPKRYLPGMASGKLRMRSGSIRQRGKNGRAEPAQGWLREPGENPNFSEIRGCSQGRLQQETKLRREAALLLLGRHTFTRGMATNREGLRSPEPGASRSRMEGSDERARGIQGRPRAAARRLASSGNAGSAGFRLGLGCVRVIGAKCWSVRSVRAGTPGAEAPTTAVPT